MICVGTNSGYLVELASQDFAACPGVLLSGVEYSALMNPDFASLGITSEQVLLVSTWGFTAVMGSWVLGLATSWVVGAIRRA